MASPFWGTYFTQFWGDGDEVITPIPPKEPPVSPWYALDITWQSWDGSRYRISDPESGAFLTDAGIRGFEMPEPELATAVAASVDGSLYLGHRIPERECFLPIHLYNEVGSAAWLQWRRQFMRSMRPGKKGLLSVRQAEGGETRSLELRFKSLDAPLTKDRSKFGFAMNGFTMVAHWPYWLGTPIPREFEVGATEDYHSEPGDSYVAFISPGTTFANASIDNPGDVPAWRDYRIEGPFTSGVVDGITIGALDEGEFRTIRTHPYGRVMRDEDGVNVTSELGGSVQTFAPIEPGESVPLSIDLTGATTGAKVTVSVTPQFFEAY